MKSSSPSLPSTFVCVVLLVITTVSIHNANAQTCTVTEYFDGNACVPLTPCVTQCANKLSLYGDCTCPVFCLLCAYAFEDPPRSECTLCGSSRVLYKGACVNSCPSGFEDVGNSDTTGRVCSVIDPESGLSADPETPIILQFESTSSSPTSDRICVDVAKCETGFFEAVAATQTSDTECMALTNCTEIGSYLIRASTGLEDNECTPYTTCSLTQYEYIAPTPTSDRECTPYTNPCPLSTHFESVPPTQTSDRVCTMLTPCNTEYEYQLRAPTTTSDRQCALLTSCLTSQYESVPANPTSDRQCSDISKCQIGVTFEVKPPTSTSDRACSSCATCSQTQYINQQCSLTTDTMCSSCTLCDQISYALRGCTATTNTECVLCSSCESGVTFEFSPCSEVADRKCSPCAQCPSGTFKSNECTTTSNTQCTAYTECQAGVEYEIQAPTSTSDRICSPVQSCNITTTYESQPPTPTSNRVCTPITLCMENAQFEQLPPTATSDRKCLSCSECAFEEDLFVNVPCSLSSDTVCEQATSCGSRCVLLSDKTTCLSADTLPPCTSFSTQLDCPAERCDYFPNLALPCQKKFTSIGAGESDCSVLPQYLCAGDCAWDSVTHFCRTRLCPDYYTQSACVTKSNCQWDASALFCLETGENVPCDHFFEETACLAYTQCSFNQELSICFNNVEGIPCERYTTELCPTDACQLDEVSGTCWDSSSNIPCDRFSGSSCPTQGTEYYARRFDGISDNLCERILICDYEIEYLQVPATPTSNAVCSLFVPCDSAQYEEQAPTMTSQRICSDVKLCDTTVEFESSAPTATSNTKCSPLANCTSSFPYDPSLRVDTGAGEDSTVMSNFSFIAIASTLTSDRICSPASICDVSEFVAILPSITSDVVCQAYSACDTMGEYEAMPPGDTFDRKCSSISTCDGVTTYQSAPPTATSDVVCMSTRHCNEEEYLVTDATKSSDRKCKAMAICSATEFEVFPPSQASQNAIDLGLYYFISNRACGLLTVCSSSDEYELLAATPSSDRQCFPYRVCEAPLVELVAPTPTSDRVCDGEVAADANLYVPGVYVANFPIQSFTRDVAIYITTEVGIQITPSKIFVTRLRNAPGGIDLAFRVLTPTQYAPEVKKAIKNYLKLFDYLKAQGYSALQNKMAAFLDCGDSAYVRVNGTAALPVPTCFPLTKCDLRTQYTSVLPTQTSDRVCPAVRLCSSPVEYESMAHTNTTDAICSPVSICISGVEFLEAPPTYTSDAVCIILTQCSLGVTFESQSPTNTSDRVCEDVSVCDFNALGEYELFPATLTSDTVCSPSTSCSPQTQFISIPSTPTSDSVCEDLQLCDVDVEFESTPPSPTSDRKCTELTPSCNLASSYQSFPATPTSDRECKPLSVCNAQNQFEKVAPTITSDRSCVTATQCTASQYEFSLLTPSTDRICRDVSVCDVNQYVKTPATATTDRLCAQCSTCSANQYKAAFCTISSNTICRDVTTCGSEAFISVPATATSDAQCSVCSRCPSNKYTLASCTATKDTTCSGCKGCIPFVQYEASSCTQDTDRVCAKCSSCKSGEFISYHCGGSTDTMCQRCKQCSNSNGMYAIIPCTSASDAQCATLSLCNSTSQYQITPPTPTTNRVCTDSTVCGSNEFERVPITITSDRVCLRLVECGSNEYEVYPPTSTSNRVCDLISPKCTVATHYQSTAPSATSDRVCSPLTIPCNINNNNGITSDDKYEIAASTPTSDRKCALATVCSETEYETVSVTPTSDRLCATLRDCPNDLNQYETVAPTATSNRACGTLTSCVPRATYEIVSPTATTNRECTAVRLACDSQTQYQLAQATLTTDRICAPLSTCNPSTQFILVERTSVSDRTCEDLTFCLPNDVLYSEICEACYLPEYRYNSTKNECIARVVRYCENFDVGVRPPFCTLACMANPTSCLDILDLYDEKNCLLSQGEYEVDPPTLTSNRRCLPVHSCLPGNHTVEPPTATSDRLCGVGSPSFGSPVVTPAPSTSNSVASVFYVLIVCILIVLIVLVIFAGLYRRERSESESFYTPEPGYLHNTTRGVIAYGADGEVYELGDLENEEGSAMSSKREPSDLFTPVATSYVYDSSNDTSTGSFPVAARHSSANDITSTLETTEFSTATCFAKVQQDGGKQKKSMKHNKVGVVRGDKKNRKSAKGKTLADIFEEEHKGTTGQEYTADATRRVNVNHLDSTMVNAAFGTKADVNNAYVNVFEAQVEALSKGIGMSEEEYNSINSNEQWFPAQAAILPDNQRKNRYRNILAMDKSRVILRDASSDYVNANHVDIPHAPLPLRYILSQGPLPTTIEDHWSMIVQQKVAVVVMVTNTQETDPVLNRAKQKCSQYWPESEGDIMIHGQWIIHAASIVSKHDFHTSMLTVRSTRDSTITHNVVHIQFVSWPDFGVADPPSFLTFYNECLAHIDRRVPTLVHCSAGVGRSGVFVLVDAMLEKIKSGLVPDAKELLVKMRSQRHGLIQTAEQYELSYRIALEFLQNRS
eukprot:m.93069 g.93069  ORF g.93069 m.93069 type:complete len:2497 (-) comp8906_c0_seq2:440-7930(-)